MSSSLASAPQVRREAAQRYNDIGVVLTNVNGGVFPNNIEDIKKALTNAYNRATEYNLPPLFKTHKTRMGEATYRYYPYFRLFGVPRPRMVVMM